MKELLKDNSVDPSDQNNIIIREAALNDNIDAVKLLLDYGIPINVNSYTLLRIACGKNNLKLIKMFFNDYGVDIHSSSDIAIRSASEYGNLELVKYLIDKGADVNACDGEVIQFAIENCHADIVELLIENGAKVKKSYIDYNYEEDHIIDTLLKKELDNN